MNRVVTGINHREPQRVKRKSRGNLFSGAIILLQHTVVLLLLVMWIVSRQVHAENGHLQQLISSAS